MALLRFQVVGVSLLALLAGGCLRKTVSFNSKEEMPVMALAEPGDSLTTTARRGQPKLSTAGRKAVLTKEEEKAAKDAEHADQRKKTKTKKNVFLGERVKRAFVKSGPKGKNQIIEVFYYLKTFKQPSELAPAAYYYDARKHKIFKANGPLDPGTDKVLHGVYKKLQNNKVLETGYYANGTRHLRWEKYDAKGSLTAKTHYEQGFPRDANISYYDAGQTMIREVVPYVNGKLEGDYVRYTADGKREWVGKFENGHRVGEWTNYWDYKNYRHYVLQYADSGYDPEPEEPELVREYSHGGSVIFDKEKNIDKRADADPDDAAKPDPRRPGSHGAPTPRAPVRKPVDRRPGYHPKPTVAPPAVPATPAGAATTPTATPTEQP
jgi:antitoxin component YwqK of YwqJK toxin-antitoxin module